MHHTGFLFVFNRSSCRKAPQNFAGLFDLEPAFQEDHRQDGRINSSDFSHQTVRQRFVCDHAPILIIDLRSRLEALLRPRKSNGAFSARQNRSQWNLSVRVAVPAWDRAIHIPQIQPGIGTRPKEYLTFDQTAIAVDAAHGFHFGGCQRILSNGFQI